jgi:hypothetical protein
VGTVQDGRLKAFIDGHNRRNNRPPDIVVYDLGGLINGKKILG